MQSAIGDSTPYPAVLQSPSPFRGVVWGGVSCCNQITVIPDAISQLSNLTRLDLSSNQIAVIPDAIAGNKIVTTQNLADAAKEIQAIIEQLSTTYPANSMMKKNETLTEQETYQNSLKYYRDLNNVVDTSREEGRLEGLQEGLVQGLEEGTRSLLIRQLSRQLGEIPDAVRESIHQLSLEALEMLGEALFEFSNTDELIEWLNDRS